VAPFDPEQLVSESIAAGMPLDDVAARLRSEGVKPMDAIKALRAGAGIHLAEAKFLVDGTLPREWQEENDRLRDLAEQAVLDVDD
jgi:ribosomal protein L7/L12